MAETRSKLDFVPRDDPPSEERLRLEALSTPAPYVDGQIAAVAYVHGLVLVTTNEAHFVGFKGLVIENWSKGRVLVRKHESLVD